MPREERQPLLANLRPPNYSDSVASGDRGGRRYEENVAQVELPSALMPQSPPYGPKIPCKVCGEIIDLTDRMDSPVVKCALCNESTPIRSAPPGKKYIRCTCKCLLICKATAQRVSCPRQDCGRVLSLAATSVPFPEHSLPGLCSVSCGYCGQAFMFNTMSNALARCPSCRKVTSVGAEFARSRGLVFLILALLSAALGIAVTLATYKIAGSEKAWLAAYIICFLMFVALLMRSIYYCTLRVSNINSAHPHEAV